MPVAGPEQRVETITIRFANDGIGHDGKLCHFIVQNLFAGLSRFQIETPSIHVGMGAVLVQMGADAFICIGTLFADLRLSRTLLDATVHMHPITLFETIGQMQDETWLGCEPTDCAVVTVSRHDAETRGLFAEIGQFANTFCQQFRIEMIGQIVQDSVVPCDPHIVGPARPRQFNRHEMGEISVCPDNAVMHVGIGFAKVEEHQLSGVIIDFEMRADAKRFDQLAPALHTFCFQSFHIQGVRLATLRHRRNQFAGMPDHINTGVIFHGFHRTPATKVGFVRFKHAGPK